MTPEKLANAILTLQGVNIEARAAAMIYAWGNTERDLMRERCAQFVETRLTCAGEKDQRRVRIYAEGIRKLKS